MSVIVALVSLLPSLAAMVFMLALIFCMGSAWTYEKGGGNLGYVRMSGILSIGGAVLLVAYAGLTGDSGLAWRYLGWYAVATLVSWTMTFLARAGWDALLPHR